MNIVITGASKGIGRELVNIFSADKKVKRIFAISRDKKLLGNFSDNKVICIPFDIASGNYATLIKEIKKQSSEIDILINNAGAIVNKPFEKISVDELKYVYEVNVFGAFKLSQLMVPLMKGRNSHIVNISSMGGYQGSIKFTGLSAYSSSKGALSILSECMAEELIEKNIAVNCLCLGATQTEMLGNAFPNYEAPLTAKEMAEFIADFAINGNKYFNGKILPVSLSTP